MHLLYARFWHKVLFDLGHLSTPEPFHKLVNQGMILGDYEYFCSVEDFRKHEQELLTAGFRGLFHDVGPRGESGSYSIKVWSDDGTHSGKLIDLPEEAVIREKGSVLLRSPRIELTTKAEKMSKSRGNVVNPDDVVDSYGADSLRLYEMFMGPLEQTKPWQMSGVEGVYRFLGRVWRMIADGESDAIQLNAAVQDVDCTPEQERLLHKTIKAVTQDVERLSFNTAISRMMEFTNEFSGAIPRPKSAMESLTLLLAPFAPHLAEECWQLLGHEESLTYTPWPTFDESKLVVDAVEVPIQINGKLRAKIMVPTGVDASTMQQLAESDEAVQSQLAGKTVVKVVAVPGRMVNFVVK
ncbi:MAG: class I tRNA ligase family protein [Planctomycetaceae bacterium]